MEGWEHFPPETQVGVGGLGALPSRDSVGGERGESTSHQELRWG